MKPMRESSTQLFSILCAAHGSRFATNTAEAVRVAVFLRVWKEGGPVSFTRRALRHSVGECSATADKDRVTVERCKGLN